MNGTSVDLEPKLSDFTLHFDSKDMVRHIAKLDRLNITALETTVLQNMPFLQDADVYNFF